MGTLSYLRNFILDRQVASVTPTSRFTIERICKYINFDKDLRIIEFGPGSGVFTKVILDRLSPDSGIIALETNRNFAATLSELRDERLTVINRSAEMVREVAAAKKWEQVDYILSGIPFSFLKKNVKHHILKDSAELLADEGYFLGYQNSSHLKHYLSEYFPHVETETEFLNIPPMCIFIAGRQ